MKPATRLQLNALATSAGATWTLVRESRHLVVDFTVGVRTVRRVLSATPSDRRALANIAADLRRALRRWFNALGGHPMRLA
jgi:hypothetical protein